MPLCRQQPTEDGARNAQQGGARTVSIHVTAMRQKLVINEEDLLKHRENVLKMLVT